MTHPRRMGLRAPINFWAAAPRHLRIIKLMLDCKDRMLSFEGLIKSLPLYFRTFWLKKSNPLLIWDMRVFASDNVSPLCLRNDSMTGFTFLSSRCFDSPVMIKSSAYRITCILGRVWPWRHGGTEAYLCSPYDPTLAPYRLGAGRVETSSRSLLLDLVHRLHCPESFTPRNYFRRMSQ